MPLLSQVAPPICEITIDPLPATGATSPQLMLIFGVLLLLAGTFAVIAARKKTKQLRVVTTGVVALTLAGSMLAVSPISAAADATVVNYGPGCTLMTIDEVTTTTVKNLLPGDRETIVTATVTNRYGSPITLRGEVQYDDSSIAESNLITEVLFDSQEGPVVLQTGNASVSTLDVYLPASAGNTSQGLDYGLTFVITAAER